MTVQNPRVTLRPAHPDDEAFIYTVYASTRADEVAAAPWSDAQREVFLKMQFAAQQRHYQGYYPGALHQIILLGEQPIGRLYVDRQEQEIRILDITILPAHRGRGIGTPIISQLMHEAKSTNRRLTIYVETFNPSRRLFERLRFVPVEETGVHLLFEWHAEND